jgi:uncharacterized protein (DUF1015 family)
MVEVSPFRGYRYDLAQVGDLSDVTCPPYDVIDPAMQGMFYKRHPCNVVRLELNRDEPGDSSPTAKYDRAKHYWKHWRIDGVLKQDPDEALYVYHQSFTWGGVHYVRKGFLGRLRLEPFGTGQVYPHEQTLSGPKADRLALFQACRANLSPIFGLYPDESQRLQQQLDDACITLTPLLATDPLGVQHHLWTVTDRAVIQAVREGMRSRPVFIADGHHRYETGLNYQRELTAAGQLGDAHAAANFTMMHFVGMQDPGLQILPTHRLLELAGTITTQELKHALEGEFQLEFVGVGESAARDTADGGWLFARLVDARRMPSLSGEHTEDWQSLGVSRLHKLVIDTLLPERFPSLKEQPPQCRFVHQWEEVSAALKTGSAQIGCLVPPATIEHVEIIGGHRETMPPKSTYFYPKLLTGMVFHSLE